MNIFKKIAPSVSVVIPCHNEEKFIAKCLDSVLQQDYPKEKMEILVINGDSKDKSKEIIETYSKRYPFIKLLENPKRFTPFAFNIGIKNAKNEIIVIMGAHAGYKKDYISKCIETLIKYEADNVGGVLKTISANNKIVTKSITECLSNFFGVGNSHFRKNLNKITKVDTVFGGCYQKEIFKKIGLFNESLVRSQDMELNIRLKKANGKILLNPEIITYYYPKSKLKDFFLHNIKDGIWAIYPFKFVKIPLKLRHYIPLIFITSLLITGFLGIFHPLLFFVFLFIISFYLIVSLYFSARIAYNNKDIKYLFLMPITFACRHFGYGFGSFWGILTIYKIKNEK